MGDLLDARQADQVLAAAYLDPRQRARAVKWLGWLAGHAEAGETIEWWAIPSWVPAVRLLTVRRLTAWAVLAVMAGAGVAFTPWAAILFGITALLALVQATFVVMGESRPPVLPPGPPKAIAFLTLGGERDVTCRDARVTSRFIAALGMVAGALLAALTLLPTYGWPGWLAATAVFMLFMLGTAVFAWLMAGRYPLLWLSGIVLGGPRLRFHRLLEDAADRQVLCRSGSGYVFRYDEVRAGLTVMSRAGSGQAREESRTGVGMRLSCLSRRTVNRIAADISIGIWVAFCAGLCFLLADPASGPAWLALLIGVGTGFLVWTVYLVLRDTLGGIVSGARWRQQHIAGLGSLRAIIVIAIGAAAAWMLIVAAGPALGGILARILPALFVGACGTWAWLLTEIKVPPRWAARTRPLANVLLVVTTAATGLILFKPGLLTAQPAAALLFPPALWGATLIWRAMNSSRRLTVEAAADITLSLLLGAELVIALVWLANLVGMPEAEVAEIRDVAQYAGSAASLPWWAWTGVYVLLAGAGLACVRWPGRLARQIRWSERLRLVPSTELARRLLTGIHIGLLVIVLAGAAGPAALAPTLHRQLKDAYMVALQRKLEATGELDAYQVIRREFAARTASPVLTSMVTSIRDTDDPAAGGGITTAEADTARRLGEFQARALAVETPPALKETERAAARAAGFDKPASGMAGLGGRAGAAEREQRPDDGAARRVETAGELAASAIASTLSIPNISRNAIFQIVWEYLGGLVEDSPLKDKLAAWAGHLPGGEAPQDAARGVVPDPEQIKAAASRALAEQYEVQGLEEPEAAGEPDIAAAVNMANQARWLQQDTGPCSPCERSPLPSDDDDPGVVVPGEDEHFSEP